MDERTLREMIAQVKHGHLSRRHFVQALAAFGLAGPMAERLLLGGGVAAAQTRPGAEFTPTRRGGGGTLRILMWDAPNL
ncbi:MAG TPA: hypothetical protein VLA62_08930, partial [Solirubrobacterales bacterium]|nr:hypothetical protein [Solirubrobacterales bacterium]